MTTKISVLGTGIMGAGMARNLVRAGFDVTVWNRSPEKARPLADDGATVAQDLAAAVAGADVVLTVLFDAAAVSDVMNAVLPALKPDAVWVQSSTVGLEATDRLAELAAKHGVGFVDAPVLGTRQPAEQGKLTSPPRRRRCASGSPPSSTRSARGPSGSANAPATATGSS